MNFYNEVFLPRVLDLVMRNREVTHYRERVVPRAGGRVLEVGVGSGLNIGFYGPEVGHLCAFDPSTPLLDMASRRMGGARFPVALFAGSGEAIPLATASVDTVVTTFTLCSIPDPIAALKEMRRVLKPAGQLLFAEHGLAPDAPVRRWQHYCTPLWRRLSGGCNLDRKMDELIAAAGFSITELDTRYARGPRALSYIYAGAARPA